jgi:hypothetical protein
MRHGGRKGRKNEKLKSVTPNQQLSFPAKIVVMRFTLARRRR